MTAVFIDLEVVKAIGLSIAFMGVMLSIITIGTSLLLYKLLKRRGKQYLKMAGLVTLWAIFIALNSQSSTLINYNPIWLVYSIAHLISIFIGAITIIIFLFMLTDFLKVFNKKLLFTVGIFIVLSLLMRIIFPFFGNPYLSLLQRVMIIIPSLLGFFIIIKSYIGGKDN